MHAGTEVILPGGALVGKRLAPRLARDATFRPFTGLLEEELAQLLEAPAASRPARVSALLAAALAQIGNEPVTPQLVARLGSTDRQFLMLAFALEHGEDQQWRHVDCASCGKRFDVGFRLSSLPVTPAGEGYPWTRVALGGKSLRLRVPTGEDEERIAGLEPREARRALAFACVADIDGESPAPEVLEALDEAALEAIDAALDALVPQLPAALATTCNECGAPHSLALDPYEVAIPRPAQLYQEVHELALRYHWSEEEILQLPRARRRMYLDLGHSFAERHP
jgi:hypothetical protein